MSTLTDLKYELTGPSVLGDGAYHLTFLCPKCRKHEIYVAIWGQPPGERHTGDVINGEDITERVWQYKAGEWPEMWANMSITPSIDCSQQGWACGGWHGFIINGEAT